MQTEQNSKNRLLTKLYPALCEFEKETGMEVFGIKIDRINIDGCGNELNKSVITGKYELELK